MQRTLIHRRLIIAAGLVLSPLFLSGPALAQNSIESDDPSHRILPPDSTTFTRWQQQAAMLYRLQQFVGQQDELPGVNDPDRQKRLKQIMQQMAVKLGQSGMRIPSQTPTNRNVTRPGNWPFRSQPGQPSARNGNRIPGVPQERGPGYIREPEGPTGDDPPDWLRPPDESRWQPGNSSGPGTSSPFDDASDSSLTLTERITRIADRARASSLGQGNFGRDGTDGGSGSGGSSWLSSEGLQAALAKAVDGAARHVAEQNGSQPRPRRRRGHDEPPLGLQAVNDTADWFSDLANRATAASESAHEPMATSSSDSSGGPSAFSFQSLILPLLLLAALGGILWWLQRRNPDFETVSRESPAEKMPRSILTRDDIVAAFHGIAAGAPAVRADWWTHRRAAHALVEVDPKSRADVEALAELYEQARYLPEEEPLTPEQISRASQAVRKIRKS